jgi:hypothetical protein
MIITAPYTLEQFRLLRNFTPTILYQKKKKDEREEEANEL